MLVWSQDTSFRRPKVSLKFETRILEAATSAKGAVLATMLASCASDILNADLYDAFLAGFVARIDPAFAGTGGMEVSITGWSLPGSLIRIAGRIGDALRLTETLPPLRRGQRKS